MALPHAILVSLCEQSGSGYELARRFNRSIGYFWSATHQQIYRTLRAMEDDGWVVATLVIQRGRPDKKVYTASDAGRAELARWIAEPMSGRGGALSDTRARDVAVKLRGAAYGDTAALRTQISALRAERAQSLCVSPAFGERVVDQGHDQPVSPASALVTRGAEHDRRLRALRAARPRCRLRRRRNHGQ
ncbi:PadR family transcriptional regulator [Candidatus Mycobacterium methanotrophicum]|uniref:PadR family transcriptional regulator n=1 Tax=Candidatus Mycobacterium methanotrophicum TaxID=2943498 RepID=UPI001C590ABA